MGQNGDISKISSNFYSLFSQNAHFSELPENQLFFLMEEETKLSKHSIISHNRR